MEISLRKPMVSDGFWDDRWTKNVCIYIEMLRRQTPAKDIRGQHPKALSTLTAPCGRTQHATLLILEVRNPTDSFAFWKIYLRIDTDTEASSAAREIE